MAQGQFAIKYSDAELKNQQLSTRLSPNIQASSSGEAQVWGAVSRVGSSAFSVGKQFRDEELRRQEEERKLKIYTERTRGEVELAKYDAETMRLVDESNDPEEIGRIREQRMQGRGALLVNVATEPESKAYLNAFYETSALKVTEDISKRKHLIQQGQAYVAFDEGWELAAETGDGKLLNQVADEAFSNRVIEEREYRRRINSIPNIEHQHLMGVLQNNIGAAMGETYDLEKGLAVVEQARKDGIIDYKDQESLDDFANSLAAQHTKANQFMQREYDNGFYDSSMNTLINENPNENLTANEIWSSQLLMQDKRFMATVVERQYQPARTDDDWESYRDVLGIIHQYNLEAIDKKDAIKQLMGLRYGVDVNEKDQTQMQTEMMISDKTFKMAVNRINHPLDADTSAEFRAAKNNAIALREKKTFWPWNRKFYDWEKEEVKNAVTLTDKWIDSQIKSGTPIQKGEIVKKMNRYLGAEQAEKEVPTREEGRPAKLGMNTSTPNIYNSKTNQIFTSEDGRKFQVTGYDDFGWGIMEEVKPNAD